MPRLTPSNQGIGRKDDQGRLDLDNTQVSDLSPLAALHQLEVLELNNTPVSDLSPLAALHQLERLELHNTQVSDYSPLAHLTELRISPEHPPKTQ